MTVRRKTKRRRPRRFHTGIHVSTKTGKSYSYRSEWEKSYMRWLDEDPSVTFYDYEALKIEYVSNKKTKRIRRYIPDFIVVRASGTEIVEIKPTRYLTRPTNAKKIAAGTSWAAERGYGFRVITEVELRSLGLL